MIQVNSFFAQSFFGFLCESPDEQSKVKFAEKRLVVTYGGLFSNINTFEDFGRDLVNEGRDIWLIEMTGGPETDCVDCPNYFYDDLVEEYWPASIAGVMSYSNQSQIDYIGHSNGCRSALSSLNEYSLFGMGLAGYYWDYLSGDWKESSLPVKPVNKFIGIACPSTLNNDTIFTGSVRFGGDYAMGQLQGVEHLSSGDYFSNILKKGDVSFSLVDDVLRLITMWIMNSNDISYNLMQYYNDLANSSETVIDFGGVDVNKLFLFNAKPNDLILSYQDALDLNESVVLVEAENKRIRDYLVIPFITDHSSISDFKKVRQNIMEELN